MWRLAFVVMLGCASAPIAKAPDGSTQVTPPVLAIAGESLEYRIALRGVVIGRLRIAVGDAGYVDGHRAVIARAWGDSAGFAAVFGKIAYELQTTLDLERDRPISHREELWAEIPALEPVHDRKDARWSDGDDYQDALSTIAILRGWKSRPGERIALRVKVVAADLELGAWHVQREYVAAAHAYAIRYDGLLGAEFRCQAWISDDPSRIPLRFTFDSEFGAVTVELVGYQLPP